MIVFWDGRLEEATRIPIDRVAVYASERPGFELDDDDIEEQGAIYSDGGGACVIPTWGEEVIYVRLVAVSESGVESEPTIKVPGYAVESVIDFMTDIFTLDDPGGQDLILTFEPIDFSEHVYWHPGGEDSAGIEQQDDISWTRLGQVLTLTGLPTAPLSGDVVSVKYAYLVGQPDGNRVTAQIVSSDHVAGGTALYTGAVQDENMVRRYNGAAWFDYPSFRSGHAYVVGPNDPDWITYTVTADDGNQCNFGSMSIAPDYQYPYQSWNVVAAYAGRLTGLAWASDGNNTHFGQKNKWQGDASDSPFAEPAGPGGTLVGVGIFKKSSWPHWNDPSYPWGNPAYAPDWGFVGRHQPEADSYYFGNKFWNDPSSEIDEPGGPLGGPLPWIVELVSTDEFGVETTVAVDGVNDAGPWPRQEVAYAVLADLTLRFAGFGFDVTYPDPDHIARADVSGDDDEGRYVGHRYTLTADGDTMVLDVKAYVDPDEEV